MKTSAWNLMVAGYVAGTFGLLAALTTIGASGTPAVVTIVTIGLIVAGILLPAAGMMRLRAAVDRSRSAARRGLALQSLGLIGLLLGALALEASSSLPVLAVSAALVVSAAGAAIAGGLLVLNHDLDVGAPSRLAVTYLVLGTALIFGGVGVILASQFGYYFVLSDIGNTVVNDAGIAVAACGFVIAAYASFVMRGSIPRAPALAGNEPPRNPKVAALAAGTTSHR